MTGFITAEGIVTPAGSDTYDYVNDQRKMAASSRTIVPVATQAAGDTVAAAMASDSRPVSDTNPLIIYDAATGCLKVKGTAGWVGQNVSYSCLQPQSGVWTFSGAIIVTPQPDGTHMVVADISVLRASATSYTINSAKVSLGVVLPSQAIGSSNIKYMDSGLNNNTLAVQVGLKPSTGEIILSAPSGSGSIPQNDSVTINVTYYI